ncbi:hypothetical protein [Ruminococcus sp. Marseille-P6503]|uniref:hypothetical protein n=1 Tax=Ruminococcus sp. Marseille-P6503 TaxID=2364796 RepID=UPI000F5264E7|nr:hypothetical protein [Ruminococcus sp. Marseille-P6503]
MIEFFKNAFKDMAEGAKAQREADKASFAAAKAESKADFLEAKAMSSPSAHKAAEQARRDKQIAEANARKAAAEERIRALKK